MHCFIVIGEINFYITSSFNNGRVCTKKERERENSEQVIVWTAGPVNLPTNIKCVKVTYLFSKVTFSPLLNSKVKCQRNSSFQNFLPCIFAYITISCIKATSKIFSYTHCPCQIHLPQNNLLYFHQTQFSYILFTKMTTCFGLRDHHQAIVINILKIRFKAVQIKFVIWDPIFWIFVMMAWWWILILKHAVIFLNKILCSCVGWKSNNLFLHS